MFVAEETIIGREGRRVGGAEYQMLVAVDKGSFALGISSPQDKHKMFFFFCQRTNGCICKGFPSAVLVRACLMSAYGQSRVEQQYSLFGPASQVSGSGSVCAYVRLYLFEYVYQRRRERNSVID